MGEREGDRGKEGVGGGKDKLRDLIYTLNLQTSFELFKNPELIQFSTAAKLIKVSSSCGICKDVDI